MKVIIFAVIGLILEVLAEVVEDRATPEDEEKGIERIGKLTLFSIAVFRIILTVFWLALAVGMIFAGMSYLNTERDISYYCFAMAVICITVSAIKLVKRK